MAKYKIETPWYGIRILESKVQISGCKICSFGQGILLRGCPTTTIVNNRINSQYMGIDLVGGSGSGIIQNNSCSSKRSCMRASVASALNMQMGGNVFEIESNSDYSTILEVVGSKSFAYSLMGFNGNADFNNQTPTTRIVDVKYETLNITNFESCSKVDVAIKSTGRFSNSSIANAGTAIIGDIMADWVTFFKYIRDCCFKQW